MTLIERATEIAKFLSIPEDVAIATLSLGFPMLHNYVTADFHTFSPRNDEQLLEWYRQTPAYIWELTAYHLDPGFNYQGMCQGVASRLIAEGFTAQRDIERVLCLGDGIGDLTLYLTGLGIDAVYHDLAGSLTAQFADFRFANTFPALTRRSHCTGQWNPEVLVVPKQYNAIVSLDFLEHVTNVEDWVRTIYAALAPGGLLCAQNAFGIGSGPSGSMPMHLERNDRFERDWDPLLLRVGFSQEGSNWYRKI